MRKAASPVNLFKYLDYRKFLKDWYQAKKPKGFSFRAFSRRAGFDSPNFFKLVMDADRNLTEKSLQKFIQGLSLNKQEQEFFKNLVFYNQSRTHEDKNFYYKHLVQSKKFKQIKPVEQESYDYYSNWYHSIVRELITSKDFDGTPEWLSDRVFPPISVKQAKASIDLLTSLRFVEKMEDGSFRQADAMITTGPESAAMVILNYHQNLLTLTKNCLPVVPAVNRDISSLTLGVKKERIPEIKRKIQSFRQDILKLVSEDDNAEEVVFVNIQMLPVTKSSDSKFPKPITTKKETKT